LAIPLRPQLPDFLNPPAAAGPAVPAVPAPGLPATPGTPALPDGASPLLRLLYGFANRKRVGAGNQARAAGKYRAQLGNDFPLLNSLVPSIPAMPGNPGAPADGTYASYLAMRGQ
jgi:hypothetical protein